MELELKQRPTIRGCCAECPSKARGYKRSRSMMGRSHRPRGEFNMMNKVCSEAHTESWIVQEKGQGFRQCLVQVSV